jgi:hypothetical protein
VAVAPLPVEAPPTPPVPTELEAMEPEHVFEVDGTVKVVFRKWVVPGGSVVGKTLMDVARETVVEGPGENVVCDSERTGGETWVCETCGLDANEDEVKDAEGRLDGVAVGEADRLPDEANLDHDGVIVTGILVLAGMVIGPSDGSETTVGRVETVNSAIVREPLLITTLIKVATVVTTRSSRRSTPKP